MSHLHENGRSQAWAGSGQWSETRIRCIHTTVSQLLTRHSTKKFLKTEIKAYLGFWDGIITFTCFKHKHGILQKAPNHCFSVVCCDKCQVLFESTHHLCAVPVRSRKTYNAPQLAAPTAESNGQHCCTLLSIERHPAILINRSCNTHTHTHTIYVHMFTPKTHEAHT